MAMASRVKFSNPKSLVKSRAAYSHVARVSVGELLFVAGQIPMNARGKLVGNDDFEAQAQQVFKNIRIALRSEGADFRNVVQSTTYLVDSRDIPKLRTFRQRVYARYFPDGRYPPNKLIVVNRLASEEIRLEIAVVAAPDSPRRRTRQ